MSDVSSKTQQELSSIRDTVESIWVAIVLAFVLRGFVVEAFVIPTGSMAPRLYGEHWDLTCPACGYEFAFGASNGHRPAGPADMPECPSCRFGRQDRGHVAGGDRVLVMKYLYRFREPEPWDVVVFKNPQDNSQNYIKRLIGLPGETIEIVHGDIFVSHDKGKTFRIRRKENPKTQHAMWHVLVDNDYRPNPKEYPDPTRMPFWEAIGAGEDRWDLSGLYGRRFTFSGLSNPGEAELELHARKGAFLPRYGYNSEASVGADDESGTDIVSDLRLETVYFPDAADSRLSMTLSSFEHLFRGEIGADGRARLLYKRTDDTDGREWTPLAEPVKLPPLEVGRGHEVALAHADFRVTFWVDGRPVLVSRDRTPQTPAGDRTRYPLDYRLLNERLGDPGSPSAVPQPIVKLAAGGGPCRLWHIKLLRDVYYISTHFRSGPSSDSDGNFARWLARHSGRPLLGAGSPGWGVRGHPIALSKNDDRPDLDEFYVLGDNSPLSQDGRLWSSAAVTLRLFDKKTHEPIYKLGTVPRYNLIGKAVFVYWPAGFHLPLLGRLPILPNVGKMRLIR